MLIATHSLSLIAFIFALVLGIGCTSLLPSGNDACANRPRYGGIDPSERFFTFAEVRAKTRREVRYTKPTPYANTGRVVSFDLVESDKFFAIVYWDATPDEGKPGIRHYSKDVYEDVVAED